MASDSEDDSFVLINPDAIPLMSMSQHRNIPPASVITSPVPSASGQPQHHGQDQTGRGFPSVHSLHTADRTFTQSNASTSACLNSSEGSALCTVVVHGLKPTISQETVQYYFESPRFGGGPVKDITVDRQRGLTFVTFEDPLDAAKVAEPSRKHSLNNCSLKVYLLLKNCIHLKGLSQFQSRDELMLFVEKHTGQTVDRILFGDSEEEAVVTFEHEVDVKQAQTILERQLFNGRRLDIGLITASGVLLVRDLPATATKNQLVFYFENEKGGRAGNVTSVVLDHERRYALLTLENAEVVPRVLEKQHMIDGHILQVSRYMECLGVAGGSEEPPFREPQPVQLPRDMGQKVRVLTKIPSMKDGLVSLLKAKHARIDDESCSDDVVIHSTITKDTPAGRKLLSSWKELLLQCLERYLETTRVDIVEFTTTAEFSAADEQLGRLTEQTEGQVEFFFQDHEQSLYIVTKTDNFRNIVEDMKKTVQTVKNRLQREAQVRSETIVISSAVVEVLQKCHIEQDVQKRFPELKVTYDINGGTVEMTGLAEELLVMRQTINSKQTAVTSLSYHFDQLTARLLTSNSAKEAMQHACLRVDPEGAVRFDVDCLTVYSCHQRKTEEMKQAALQVIHRVEIPLGEEYHEAINHDDFLIILSSLQQQYGDRLVIDRQPLKLTVLGVMPTFDTDITSLVRFLEDHKLCQQTFNMDKPQQELVTNLIRGGQIQVSVEINDIEFNLENSTIIVTNTKQVIQNLQRKLEDMDRNKIVEHREFTLPNFEKFLHSQPGKNKLKEVQNKRYCIIEIEKPETDAAQSPPGYPVLTGQTSTSEQQATRRQFTEPHPSRKETASTLTETKKVARKPRIFIRPMSDITKEEHDVVVNSSNCSLNLKLGQVSSAILEVGGDKIQAECSRKYPKGIEFGGLAVTGPGRTKEDSEKDGKRRLLYKNIHHCCLPETKDHHTMRKVVKNAVMNSLNQAEKDRRTSVGFPALGTGILQYPANVVAPVMFETVMHYGCMHPNTCISDVFFILHKKDKTLTEVFRKENEKYMKLFRNSLEVERNEVAPAVLLSSPQTSGIKKDEFFSSKVSVVRLQVTAVQCSDLEGLDKDLLEAYEAELKRVPHEMPELASWDHTYVQQTLAACRAVDVDVTFNFSLERLELYGFRDDVQSVPLHRIIKDAENDLQERQNAKLLAPTIQWSWVQVDEREMKLKAYDMLNNYRIEKSYREGKENAIVFDSNLRPFFINFIKMEEIPEFTEQATGRDVDDPPIKIVRQEIVIEGVLDAPVPDTWRDMRGQYVDLVKLNEEGREFQQVQDKFLSSLGKPCVVVKIERIQNLALYKQYMALKGQMKLRFQEVSFEMSPLWHGTEEKNVDNIIRNGFNRSYCERTNYGQGAYFAKKAEYSSEDKYAKNNSKGDRHMFYCRVLVGEYTKGNEAMRYPPRKAQNSSNYYDSTVDDTDDPNVFVIFKDAQAYPDYLVVFRDA